LEGETDLPGHWRGPEALHCYQWVEWQGAEALKGVESKAQADHVHVINAEPEVVAAVKNYTQILNLFLKPHTVRPQKEVQTDNESYSTHEGDIILSGFVYTYTYIYVSVFLREGRGRRYIVANCCLSFLDLGALHVPCKYLNF
jgi:hypothetical protein